MHKNFRIVVLCSSPYTLALKIFTNLKNISDETSKCSHFSSTGSILANFFLEIIIIDMGNTLYLLESRLKVIRGPELFFPLRLNICSERTSSVRLTICHTIRESRVWVSYLATYARHIQHRKNRAFSSLRGAGGYEVGFISSAVVF